MEICLHAFKLTLLCRPPIRDKERWLYQPVPVNGKLVHFCHEQRLINATQFCNAQAQGIRRETLLKTIKDMNIGSQQFRGQPHLQGTYVSYQDMKKLCAFLGLRKEILNTALRQLRTIRDQKDSNKANCHTVETGTHLTREESRFLIQDHTAETFQQTTDMQRLKSFPMQILEGPGDDVPDDQQESAESLTAALEAADDTFSSLCSVSSSWRGITYPSGLSLSCFR
jgi:hypothetical protein